MSAVTPLDIPAAEPASAPHGGRFAAPEKPFWRLLIRGAVLLAVTLGIYRFWLATDVRRFLWNHTEIAGDGLEYVGTARELLLGFLIAIVLLVPVNVMFFLAAFSGGALGQISGALALAVLALFGQFAVYRARRYRLTRTVYRGIRFHQTGSAWRYAVCALFWWGMIGVTFGLAYPFAQASLERFKMRNTYYGDLQGHFVGSGLRLFFRGVLFWVVVVVPFLLGMMAAIVEVDWSALAEAMRRSGDDIAGRIEGSNVGAAVSVAVIGVTWSIIAAALLYPAFQAMVLRWWVSGLRFGTLTVASRLRTGAVYALYLRFMWIALLAGAAIGIAAAIGFGLTAILEPASGTGVATQLLATAVAIASYVAVALAYSTIYQATVRLRLWKCCVESLEFSGLEAFDRVKASGAPSSALGEGLADALNVGGI
jgi:uncharacterized membrane protein YjgN (DUF898 family)